jgi:hypothetical protein
MWVALRHGYSIRLKKETTGNKTAIAKEAENQETPRT